MRKGIRKVFESRAFYIVFSILASLSIWLYVAYIENPDVSKEVKGIKIEYINEDYVTDRELVITNRSTDTVKIEFTGKRSTVTQLDNQNVTVTVDLSEITDKGTWQLTYDPNLPMEVSENSVTMSGTPTIITLTVDEQEQKEVSVKGTYGSVADGYLADTMEISPSTITVYGPQEIVSKIDHAWVNVPRDNISKTVDEELSFTLMDAEGHEVVSDMLTFSQDTVSVHIQVDMMKELPLDVNLTPSAGADETNTTLTITPATITISGDAEILGDINKITLGTIDLGSFLTATTETFQILLPDGTKNLTGLTTATVAVSISGLDSTHVNATNIETTNVAQGLTAEILTSTLDILLRGTQEEIDQITENNISVVADLSEYSTGVFSVVAKVYINGDFDSIGAIGEYKITVTISNTVP